jgi:hypothetical protein
MQTQSTTTTYHGIGKFMLFIVLVGATHKEASVRAKLPVIK